jgi:hypothetical protein
MRTVRTLFAMAVLSACLASVAAAQDSRAVATKLTYMTFSGPVQVPSTTLPAGTYKFQMTEPGSHILQIFNQNGSKIFATIQTIPSEAADPEKARKSDATVVMFGESPAGAPQAVKMWFYPGTANGEEFVYPKDEATKIAKAYHTSVLASDRNASGTTARNGNVGRVNENGEFDDIGSRNQSATTTTTNRAAPTTTTTSEARSAQSSRTQPTGTSGSSQAATPDTTRRLPQTASSLALVELLAAIACGGAFLVRTLRILA